MDISKLEYEAIIFATEKHASINQKRKYTQEDYINHPRRVANIVRSVPGHSKQMLAAAWLHDTVEDTDATLGEVYELFGEKVAQLVEMLTDVAIPEDGNRKTRMQINLNHTKKANPEAQTIKLADLIDNSDSIFKYDENFAKIYAQEKRCLIEVLNMGDSALMSRAKKILDDYESNKTKTPLKLLNKKPPKIKRM